MGNLEASWQFRAAVSKSVTSEAWKAFCDDMDTELLEAQEKWDAKFKKTWTQSATDAMAGVGNAIVSYCSPTSSKRKTQGASEAGPSKRRLELPAPM